MPPRNSAVTPKWNTEHTPVQCLVTPCNHLATNGYALVQHINTSHRGALRINDYYHCPFALCPTTTHQYTNFETHLNRHLGLAPHRCPHLASAPHPRAPEKVMRTQCAFRTADPAALSAHRKTHADYAPPPRAPRRGTRHPTRVVPQIVFAPGYAPPRESTEDGADGAGGASRKRKCTAPDAPAVKCARRDASADPDWPLLERPPSPSPSSSSSSASPSATAPVWLTSASPLHDAGDDRDPFAALAEYAPCAPLPRRTPHAPPPPPAELYPWNPAHAFPGAYNAARRAPSFYLGHDAPSPPPAFPRSLASTPELSFSPSPSPSVSPAPDAEQGSAGVLAYLAALAGAARAGDAALAEEMREIVAAYQDPPAAPPAASSASASTSSPMSAASAARSSVGRYNRACGDAAAAQHAYTSQAPPSTASSSASASGSSYSRVAQPSAPSSSSLSGWNGAAACQNRASCAAPAPSATNGRAADCHGRDVHATACSNAPRALASAAAYRAPDAARSSTSSTMRTPASPAQDHASHASSRTPTPRPPKPTPPTPAETLDAATRGLWREIAAQDAFYVGAYVLTPQGWGATGRRTRLCAPPPLAHGARADTGEGEGEGKGKAEAEVVFPDDVMVRSEVAFADGLEGGEGEDRTRAWEGVKEGAGAVLGSGDVASTFVLAEIMDDALAAHRCEECALCVAP